MTERLWSLREKIVAIYAARVRAQILEEKLVDAHLALLERFKDENALITSELESRIAFIRDSGLEQKYADFCIVRADHERRYRGVPKQGG